MSEERTIQQLADGIKAQGYAGICYWLPSRATAGGVINFVRQAQYIAENTDLKVYYVDYADGYAHDILANSLGDIQFVDYDPNAQSLPLEQPVIVVVNSTRVVQIKNLPPTSKILLWHWETVPCAWDVVLLNNEAKRLLKLANENNALVYHDWSSRNIFKQQFGFDFSNKDYVATYCDPKEVMAPPELVLKDHITVGWLGRLSTDKRLSLYNLMDNLAALNDPRPKRLVVIGDGQHRREAEAYAGKYKDQIEVIFVGTIANEELADCMTSTMDIVFAVGTSVLEAAACHLPAAVCQMSTTPISDDQYVLLYDTEEYCLGMTCEQKKDFPGKFASFSEIINQVYSGSGKAEIGKKCYTYYHENYDSLVTACEKILQFCERSSLTIEKLRGCIKYIPYNKLHVKAWRCHGLPVASVTTYENVKTWHFFKLPVWKVEYYGAETRYYPFGIRMMRKYDRGVFSFPGTETRFVPGKKSLDERHVEAFYKKEKHRRDMIERLTKGEKLRVCLFVSRISCWSFDRLYRLLEESPYFIPTVVVKPFMTQGHDAMVQYMDTTYEALTAKGYRVIRTYDEETNTYLDLRSTFDPDILVYTKAWYKFFQKNFYIDQFFDRITFLSDYFYLVADHVAEVQFDLSRLVDRYFLPNTVIQGMAKKAMKNEGKNTYVIGSPKLDPFFDKSYQPKDIWKPQGKRKKRIIWAPHHSDAFPNNLYQFNAFFELYDFMFEIAEQYKDSIQIAFRPHPMLRYKLEAKWGKEESDAYYAKWEELENGQYENGEFIDLFLTSDAMIFDSISFIAEYTAVNKPALFTIGPKTRVKLSEFGMMTLDLLYKTEEDLYSDIRHFIEKVVLAENDVKHDKRQEFIDTYILPPNGKSASENLYDNICEEVLGDLYPGHEAK